jgi:ABC-type dipeptide/oligopeptide/nickel transport system permease subunit
VATRGKQSTVASAGAGLAAEIAIETGGEFGAVGAVRARGYWDQVWRRLRRDRVALVSGGFIVLLILAAFIGAPVAARILGHGPDGLIPGGIDKTTFLPVGPMTRVESAQGESTLLILGGSDSLGRDEFLRLLYGAQVSLEVAVFATILGVAVGVTLGLIAGFYAGWIDTLVSRLTDIVMAFPLLLFAIALASTVGDRLNSVTVGGIFAPGIISLVIVIGAFSWYYPARIIRAQVLSLREKEFIEAARMVGASDFRIMRSHLLPHLVAPIIVYSTLIIASNILFEAGLSFLGLGVPLPHASWGNLLSTAVQFYTVQPWLMLWPGLAILLATLAFNLLGDGLRDAFDPRGSR